MSKQKWSVTLEYRYLAKAEVEADTQEEAIEVAEGLMEDGEIREEYDAYVAAEAKRIA